MMESSLALKSKWRSQLKKAPTPIDGDRFSLAVSIMVVVIALVVYSFL